MSLASLLRRDAPDSYPRGLVLLPLAGLAALWLLLQATRPEIWAWVPGNHAFGAAVVLALALGVLATTVVVGLDVLDRRSLRLAAALAFLGFLGLFLLGENLIALSTVPGPGWIHVAETPAYGPLVIWPALWVFLPKLGLRLVLPLGRVMVLVATAAPLAVSATLAVAALRRSARPDGTTGGVFSAGTACALATSGCPGCYPILASWAVSLLGASVAAPWVQPITVPGTLVSETLSAAAPLLAVGALLRVTSRGAGEGGSRRGWSIWGLVAAAIVGGALLAIPVATLFPMNHVASPRARAVTHLYDWVNHLGIAVIFAFEILLVGIVLRGRRKTAPDPRPASRRMRNLAVSAWVVIPLAILISVLSPALAIFQGYAGPLAGEGDPYTVNVTAMQWGWQFQGPHGNSTLGHLTVPQGAHVRFRVRSLDVVHSLFIPDEGVRVDAVPGRVNTVVFTPDTPGTYLGVCAEFCGIGHPQMTFHLTVAPAGAGANGTGGNASANATQG